MTEPAPPATDPVVDKLGAAADEFAASVAALATDEDRPPRSAPKDEWVAYAIDQGRPSYEAWALTKEDLVKEYASA